MPELVTWYAVIPIAKRDDGWLACDNEAVECATADDAARIAKVLARKPGYCAAVAFARTGDVSRYYEAEIIKRVGNLLVPGARLGSVESGGIDPKKGP